jgi:hypothetical protein
MGQPKIRTIFSADQPQNASSSGIFVSSRLTLESQEIAAANIFINGNRIPSLLNNHYYWVELPAGTYRISTSRPLTVFHFQEPKYIDLTVDAGQSYYLKYDEENNVKNAQGHF